MSREDPILQSDNVSLQFTRDDKLLTITATTRILVVVPSSTKACTLLQNNEVLAFVALEKVDCHANSRDPGPDYHN
jgi:hypothetical protein